jgi:hypothetical protein
MDKKKGAFTRRRCRADQTAFREQAIELRNEKQRYNQSEENNAQNNGDPEQCALDAATSRKDTTGVRARQSAQSCPLALQDHAQDEQDGDDNQRNI